MHIERGPVSRAKKEKMKSFKCTDGFVTKTISAATAQEAAEVYAIASSSVDVVEVDVDDNEIGEHTTVEVSYE